MSLQVTVYPTFAEGYWNSASQLLILQRKLPDERVTGPGEVAKRQSLAPPLPETHHPTPVSSPTLYDPNVLFAGHTRGADLSQQYDVREWPESTTVQPAVASWRSVPLVSAVPHALKWYARFGEAWTLPAVALVWLICIAGLQIDNAICSALLLIAGTGIAVFQFAQADRLLLRIVLHQFDMWYLATQTGLFVLFAVWSQSDNFSLLFHFAYALPLLTQTSVILTADSALGLPYLSKLTLFVSGFTLFAQVFIRSLARDEMQMVKHGFCVLLCTDTTQMMFACGFNALIYYVKYITQTFTGLLNGRTRFVTVRMPLYITQQADGYQGDPSEMSTRLARLSSTSRPDAPVSSSSCDGLRVDSAPDQPRGASSLLLHSLWIEDSFSRTRLAGLAAQCDMRVLIHGLSQVSAFEPVIPYTWRRLHRLAQSRAYLYGIVGFGLATCGLLIANGMSYNYEALNWVICWTIIAICFTELTRFDRTLVSATIRRYEYVVISLSTLQFCVFGLWAQLPDSTVVKELPLFCMTFALVGGLVPLMDAAPGYPRWFRLVTLGCMCFNFCRVFAQNYFFPYYNKHDVCFIFCSDTRQLSQAALATMAIFLLKYLWVLIRFPGRCAITCAHLYFTLALIPPASPSLGTPRRSSVKSGAPQGVAPSLDHSLDSSTSHAHRAVTRTLSDLNVKPVLPSSSSAQAGRRSSAMPGSPRRLSLSAYAFSFPLPVPLAATTEQSDEVDVGDNFAVTGSAGVSGDVV